MNIREKFNLKFNMDDYKFLGVRNSTIVEEASKLLKMPKKDDNDTDIPNELTNGDICIGTTVKNGEKVNVYFNHNPYHDVGLIVTGKMGSGKSLYLQNYINDCVKKGDSVVVIDYIKNSDLTSNIKEIVPEDKLVVLDFENVENLQSLSYNELNYTDNMSENYKIKVIYRKSTYMLNLLNSLSDEELTVRGRRDFLSIANVIYSVDNNASLKNIVDCLDNESSRIEYINKVPEDLRDMLEDEIRIVANLNDSFSSKEQILNRVNLLKNNTTTSSMFKKNSENNINFNECVNEGKVVVVKIDSDISYNSNIKDMISLFFITKTFLACQNRTQKFETNSNRTHLIIDEVCSLPKTLKELNEIFYQSRVVSLKPVLTTQSLSSLPDGMLETMNIVGFNYMFTSNLDKNTYNIFKSDLHPYTFNDLSNIKKYYSLNLVQSNSGKEAFITKLPDVLEVYKVK